MQYITLRDQGFYEPFEAARRGVNNLIGLYNMYKEGGTEDERRTRLGMDQDKQQLNEEATRARIGFYDRKADQAEQAFQFKQQEATRDRNAAEAPGHINLEALSWPVAEPGGDLPFYQDLPGYQQKTLARKYPGVSVPEIYDQAVQQATGQNVPQPAPQPIQALPITVNDPQGNPTTLGYQAGNRILDAPKPAPAVPEASPIMITDPTTGKERVGFYQVGDRTYTAPDTAKDPNGITLTEELPGGVTIRRPMTTAEYEQKITGNRQQQLYDDIAQYGMDGGPAQAMKRMQLMTPDQLNQVVTEMPSLAPYAAQAGLNPQVAPPQPQTPAQKPAPATNSEGPPLITTQQEFDALPSGALYRESNGQTYRKP